MKVKTDECDWMDRGVIGQHALSEKLQKKLCQLCGRRHLRLSKLTGRLVGNVSFTLTNGVTCMVSKINKYPNVQMSFVEQLVDFVNPHRYHAFAGVKEYLFEFTIANKKLEMFASCSCPYYVVDQLMGTLKIRNSDLIGRWVFEGVRYPPDEAPSYEKRKYSGLFLKAIETNTSPEIVVLYDNPPEEGKL